MSQTPDAKRQKTNGFGHCSRRTSMEEEEVSEVLMITDPQTLFLMLMNDDSVHTTYTKTIW